MAQKDEAKLSGRSPLPVAKIQELIPYVSPSVCRVHDGEKCANGFLLFMKGNSKDHDIYTFVTNNHVIGDINPEAIERILLDFESLEQLRMIHLRKDDLGYCWTSTNYDATFLELKVATAARMLNMGAKFLTVRKANIGKRIAVFGHPQGLPASIDFGPIAKIIDGYQILHSISTKPGNSGSPVLTLDGVVVGIHKASYDSEFNIAIHLDHLRLIFIREKNKNFVPDTKGKLTQAIRKVVYMRDIQPNPTQIFWVELV